MKILQVSLTEAQHKKLRVMSAERCVAMSELVRWWIDGNIAVEGAKPAGVKPHTITKHVEDWGNASKPKPETKSTFKTPTATKYPGGSINPMNALICCVCGKEIQGEGYTYNKDKKPICQPCAHKVAGV